MQISSCLTTELLSEDWLAGLVLERDVMRASGGGRMLGGKVGGRQVVVDPWLGVNLMRGLAGGGREGGRRGGARLLLVNTVVHLIKIVFSRLKLTTKSISKV